MKVMILAAGRGERMMPLTKNTPKPMLKVAGKPLLQYHIENLEKAGITDIVINLAWCGEKIKHYFGDGSDFGVSIKYSDEVSGALETAGGIAKALPLLGAEPFLVINGDIFTDYNFANLPSLSCDELAHLIMVENPEHNPSGDFSFKNGFLGIKTDCEESYTFAGIALYQPAFFEQISGKEKLALGPKLRQYAQQGVISGTVTSALWVDVGTPERLANIELEINKN